MKKILIMLLLVMFIGSGCTGSFNLTRTVYNWHRSQDGKWADEVGFLVCALTPVYGISTMVDAIVLNSIEFWTGENPVTDTEIGKAIKKGDTEASISYDTRNRQMKITTSGKDNNTITVQRGENVYYTKDKNGEILYTTMLEKNGEVVVLDKGMQVVKKYLPSEVKKMGEEYSK